MRKSAKSLIKTAAVLPIALGLAVGSAHAEHHKGGCNPCSVAEKVTCNPCGAKKAACNPCNPCGAKKAACNPCNPCGAKKGACNPCSPK